MVRVWRRAKSVVLSLDDDAHLAVTPRFTGALILGAPGAADAYACLRLRLGDGRELRYTDVRRLGTVALLSAGAFAGWSGALGPEPLDPEFTAERFSVCLRGSKRAIKAVLMDQSRLAGVGNIYANEALWRCRIRPTRRASSLARREREALHQALIAVLGEAVEARGTSFRDYRDAFGERGGYAAQLQAYGRGGEPCTRCGAPLKSSHAIDGRITVWCAACQR
jgi:formamidopyrimidine-DNA glycosylase